MIKICPLALSCRFFNGLIKIDGNDFMEAKRQYCIAGRMKYTACKRFVLFNNTGSVSDEIMPELTLTDYKVVDGHSN